MPLPTGPDDSFADIYGRPGHLIRRLQQIAVAIFLEETKDFDITPVQYATLLAVRAIPGMDQTRLVSVVALDRSTIANVLARLEAKGLVYRSTPATDKRVKLIHLTPQGDTLIDAVTPAVDRIQTRIVAPLPAGQRQLFMQMLTQIVDLNNEFSRAPLRTEAPEPISRK